VGAYIWSLERFGDSLQPASQIHTSDTRAASKRASCLVFWKRGKKEEGRNVGVLEKPRRTTTQSHKENETEIYEVRQSYLRPRGRKEMRNTRNFEEYNILSHSHAQVDHP